MNIDKVRKYILPNLPYVFIFWFATKLGEAYRLTPGMDFFQKLTGMVQTINTVFSSPLPSLEPTDLLFGLAGVTGVYLAVWVRKKNAKKYRKDTEHGSARWGTPADIRPYTDSNPKNNIILTQTEALTMNSRPALPKYARNKNVLVIGGSGSGKTRFFIKPNLMQCESQDYPVSFVTTDPKGSLILECGAMLRRYGYRIKVLNTINFSKSMKYNPFAYIRSEKDILKLVTTLITNTTGENKGGDDFWVKAEQLLYTALIAYLHYEAPPHERNFSTLAEMISAMEVREGDESFENVIDLMFKNLAEKDPEHFAVRQYTKYKLAAGKTVKSILISCGARLAPFEIGQLREIISYDEMELDLMGDRKTATFFIISDTDVTFNFIVALAFSQMFNLLCERADTLYSKG